MRKNLMGVNRGKAGMLMLGMVAGAFAVNASTDYGPAIFRQAYSGHWYTSGHGHKFVVIHDMEGYYASTISYLQRSSTQVSIHYCVNGKKDSTSDYPAGEVTQMVREAYYAWHVRCWNTYCLGTEHEGFASNPAWFTEAMYQSSALLQRHMCDKFGIAKDRNHVVGHNAGQSSAWRSYASANFGIDPSCNSHTDPGPSWNWTHFMDLIKGTVSTPSAPSSLLAATVSSSQIKLTWKDNSGIETGFKIERGTASGGPFTQIATVGANVLTYTAGSLSSGVAYYFRVRAYNATGNSPYSNVSGATTKDTIPGAPTALTATAVSSAQINLAWTQGAGNEDGFKIFRSTDNTNFTQVATVGINVVSYANTGLLGNTRYYYKVVSYNTAGNSAFSNTANDITAPQAPSGLTATAPTYNTVNLSWTDNSSSEVGFKIERGTAAAGPFTQIATNAAGVTTFTDTGRAATTAYYYRVRSYNANGDSVYSNVASITTPNAPPVLGAIGNQNVNMGNTLTFTATATDPNANVVTTTWQTFESFTNNTPNEQVMFNRPLNSSTTAAFQDTSTNYSTVTQTFPATHAGSKVMKVGWGFKTGQVNPWVRLNTFNPPQVPNPTVDGAQVLRFDIYSTKALKVGLGFRETGTAAAYGANGGTTGTIEWVGVTNTVSGAPLASRQIAANTWTTLSFNIPFEPANSFTGDGVVNQVKGVLESLILGAVANASGAYTVYLDNFAVVAQNTLTYSLAAGAPAGAIINGKTGKFSWTPSAGQVGNFDITVKVTDQLGAVDSELIKVTVISGGNNPPVLAAIGNKTVNEGSTLTFTATATDFDAGQTKTFTLDAGAPAGASINPATGVFTWTPGETQGGSSYPITVRVTDNGTPATNDFETITVTVNEVNSAPTLAAIGNQAVNEGSLLTVAASGSDTDVPANTLTYSLDPGAPAGMAINSSSGVISWTPTESHGPSVYPVTVRVTDNGSPSLNAKQSFNVTVNEVNVAPVLTLGTSSTSVTLLEDFDAIDPEATDGTVFFRKADFSSSTSGFIDTAVTRVAEISTNYPDLDVNTSLQALHVSWGWKAGTTNPWVRLTTATSVTYSNLYADPNPTIDLGQRVRFDIWTDKALKVGLGVRETGTGAPVGGNGGTTGSIEWIGVSSNVGGQPQPVRTVAASNWVTLEFNLPAEPITALAGSGNGVLAAGKGVLEHLALVPVSALGTVNVYLDNFQVVKVTTNLVVDTLATLTVTNSATDADIPANNLTFSLGAGAPTNAVIDPDTGVFSWTPTPAQSPSTNVIPVIVTDDGVPPLSDTKNLIVIVNKVNTTPHLGGVPDQTVEVSSGQSITFTATGEDDDIPADTLTFSLTGSVPAGATINSNTGDFNWTPPAGSSTNVITVRVTDNGTPPLFDEQSFTVLVAPSNAAPVLSLVTGTVTETVANFETFTNNTPNEYVLFNKPANSSTTISFLDTSTNYTTVTTTFPSGHTSAKVMKVGWGFNTTTSNQWLRLNTLNATKLPNPTINFNQAFKFDVYTTKALKIGLGLRETSTSAAIGADGGTTGTLEWVGVPGKNGSAPNPSRTIAANTWTTLTFNIPTEAVVSALGSGDGVLTSTTGKGVLEHLALVPAGGTGAYTVYLDNFQVVTSSNLANTVYLNTGSTLTFTATATDADLPAQALDFGLDADAPAAATIDQSTGAFTWTPAAADIGTNSITVFVNDEPTNGGITKTDSKTFVVVVANDPAPAQRAVVPPVPTPTFSASAEGGMALNWPAASGKLYRVQYKNSLSDERWTDVTPDVMATGSNASLTVTKDVPQRFYRIVLLNE